MTRNRVIRSLPIFLIAALLAALPLSASEPHQTPTLGTATPILESTPVEIPEFHVTPIVWRFPATKSPASIAPSHHAYAPQHHSGIKQGHPSSALVAFPSSCIIDHESRHAGVYVAHNSSSSAAGAYQMVIGTSNNAARAIGHPELVGRGADQWPPAAQDQAAAWVWSQDRHAWHDPNTGWDASSDC